MTGIELPAAIVTAINRKTEQYYIAEEYKFRVEREKRESERKKIEAEGIRDFQQTVSQGISDLIPALARHRGDASTFAIHECENSHHRQRERRSADHPQHGHVSARRGSTQPAENDTGKQRPTAAGPAMPLEKTQAEALATPAEEDPAVDFGYSARSSYAFCCCSGGAALVLAAQSRDDQVLSPDLVGRNGAEGSGSLKSADREVGRSSDHP